MTASWLASLALSLALVFWTTPARAQNADNARADALFREGRALMKKGDYTSACAKLEESQRLDPAPGTAANLGACFEKQGKVGSALLAYQAARDLLPGGDSRLGPIDQQIASLEKRAPRLTIKLASKSPRRTKVRRDERIVEPEKLGVPIALNPGQHVVVVSAPGRNPNRYETELAEGDSRELVVEPGEPDEGDEPSTPSTVPLATRTEHKSPVEPSNAKTIVLISGAALTAVGLGVGVGFMLDGNSAKSRADDLDEDVSPTECNTNPNSSNCIELNEKRDRQNRSYKIGTVGFVGAGIFGVATVATWLLWPERQTEEARAVRVELLMGGPARVGLRGVF